MSPRLKEVGEGRAIELVRARLGRTPDLGEGEDDCAAVPIGGGRLLLATVDILVGPTHVLPGTPPEMLGAFAVETAVSDIAAMGGTPLGVLCALGLPPETDSEWLALLAKGMARACQGHDAYVLGGDTKAAPEPTIAMTALGTVDEDRCLFRRGALPGDALVLTGPLAGPAVAYYRLKGSLRLGLAARRAALLAVYGVKARVEDGLALGSTGFAHACIDLSDGLGPALHQILGPSRCGAVVGWDDLPMAQGLPVASRKARASQEHLALHFGGEYELLAAVDPGHTAEVLAALRAARAGATPRVVGRVTRDREILLELEDRQVPIGPEGFDHFRGAP
jgi:thiamine-monophosphate kinase